MTYTGNLLACLHKASLNITQGARQNVTRKCVECEGPTKAIKRKKKSQGQKEASQSHGTDAAKKS